MTYPAKFGAINSRSTNSKMDCKRVEQLLSPYLDGAVTGTEMHALQKRILSIALRAQGKTRYCVRLNNC